MSAYVGTKDGRCWLLQPHQWTKWSEPDQWINPNQYRYCLKCGKYERRWVPA